jgi:hypothetical protein
MLQLLTRKKMMNEEKASHAQVNPTLGTPFLGHVGLKT